MGAGGVTCARLQRQDQVNGVRGRRRQAIILIGVITFSPVSRTAPNV